MDYKKILKTYPKGMDSFCMSKFGGDAKSCMKNSSDRFWGALSMIHDRELYDFFDAHKIFITLKIVDRWDYLITDGEGRTLHNAYDYKYTRMEAETAAFLKAFKLLEPKLKDGTTTGTMQKV